METTEYELPCGCRGEFVAGKFINILCEEHEEEYQDMLVRPPNLKKTKMRADREI